MKSANRNSLIALALLAGLILPGLAKADNWKQPQRHTAPHYQAQGHDAHRGNDYARGHDNYRHERYEHHYRYQHGARVVHYSAPPVYRGYVVYPGVYPGAYTGVPPGVYAAGAMVTGVIATPSVGLVINLR